MNARLLVLLVVGLVVTACQHVQSPGRSTTLAEAEKLIAKIRPGMTLGEARRIVPHISEHPEMMSHGGLLFTLDISEDYSVSFRVSHREPQRGSSEYERNLMSDQQKLIAYYDHNVINLSPCLYDRRTGKQISGESIVW